VGKKPPQSQKGGSYGLTPRTSTRLSPKEQNKKNKNKNKNKNNCFFFFFSFYLLVAGDLSKLCGATCAQQDNQNINLIFIYIFYFLSCYNPGRRRPSRAPRSRLRPGKNKQRIFIFIFIFIFLLYFLLFLLRA
jgi:hypothetical protein